MIHPQLVHIYDTPIGFPNVRVRSRVGRLLAIALLGALFAGFAYLIVALVGHQRSAPTFQAEPPP